MTHTQQFLTQFSYIARNILLVIIIYIIVLYIHKFYDSVTMSLCMKLSTTGVMKNRDETPPHCPVSKGYDIKVCFDSIDVSDH